MRKAAIIILLSLMFASFAYAQTEDEPFPDAGTVKTKTPTKLDEFGDLKECELRARLDNFLIAVMNEPESRGYIIFYQEKDGLPGRREVRG